MGYMYISTGLFFGLFLYLYKINPIIAIKENIVNRYNKIKEILKRNEENV